MQPSRPDDRLDRRTFLCRSTLASIGMGLLPVMAGAQTQSSTKAEVRRYVPLGRTGIKMSDISFGASRLGAGEEDLVR